MIDEAITHYQYNIGGELKMKSEAELRCALREMAIANRHLGNVICCVIEHCCSEDEVPRILEEADHAISEMYGCDCESDDEIDPENIRISLSLSNKTLN